MKASRVLSTIACGHRVLSTRVSIGILCAIFVGQAVALPTDREKAIHISSDSADIDDATGVATYRGNVVMSQGTTLLKGDVITVYVKSKKIARIVSKGGKEQAYYEEEQTESQGILKAWGNTIDYDLASEIVALTHNARLVQRGDTFVGNNIAYDQKKQLVNAAGDAGKNSSGRVQMVIQPRPLK